MALGAPTLCAPSDAWAQGASVHDATEDQKADAQVKFLEARKAFDERRFVDAIAGFRASFDVVASPNTHLMITHAMRELGRFAEAYEELEGVEREAAEAAKIDEKYEQTVTLAREEKEALRAKMAFLSVTIPSPEPGATLTIGERDIPADRWGAPIPVDPGTTTVIYQGSGDPIVRKIQAEPGGQVSVTLEAAPEAPPPPPPQPVEPVDQGYQWQWTGTQRYIAYGVAGLGVAALITSGVTGGLALSKHGDLEDACGDSPCPDRQDDIDSGKTLMTTTNILLIAGAVLVGGGVALYFTAPDENTGDEGVTALRLGPGTLGLEGRF
jgi:hypothetical protein